MSTVVAKNLAVQTSAGTASTNISFDGTKLVSTALDNSITATANLHDLGVGQTWQDVTASRTLGVTYTNSTGKPIMVSVSAACDRLSTNMSFYLNDLLIGNVFDDGTRTHNVSLIVPVNSRYMFSHLSGTIRITKWSELR